MPAAGKRTLPAHKRTTPARKCRRTCAPPVPELPVCVLLEIAARTDASTIFRCSATCKQLRREILRVGFVRRVCQGPDAVVPSRTLGVLGETFSVVHPPTVASVTLERYYLSPFMSRSGSIAAAGLLERYKPQTSRNGLVVLSHREINSHCALLTAADGIGCSFMLVAADMARNLDCRTSARVRVQTVSSPDSDAGGGAQWSPIKTTDDHPCPWWCISWDSHEDAAVVVSGVVHWLMHAPDAWLLSEDDVDDYILTYDVDAAAVGSVDIPKDRQRASTPRGSRSSSSQLASSPDGKLSFVATHQCTVSVWVLSSGGSWAWQVEIDMMVEWGPLLGPKPWMDHRLELESFGDQRSGAVFLQIDGVFFALNMETGATSQTSLTRETGIPYDVDLASRLASMKSF